MERIFNFRPLASGLTNRYGKRIRENTILRSGQIANASERDVNTLADYGIGYIYDFRSAVEVERSPALSSPFFVTRHVDVLHESSPFAENLLHITAEDGIAAMKQLYGTQLSTTDRYKPAITAILAQQTDAFLYHCSAGKDRTGIFSAILMMALDFDADAIQEEYLRIDTGNMAALKAQVLRHLSLPQDTDSLDFMFGVRKEYIDAYLAAVLKAHGSADAYLEDVAGITSDTKRILQEKYLM